MPFYPRTELIENGTILQYGIFNNIINNTDKAEYKNVTLRIDYIHGGVRTLSKYVLAVSIQTESEEYMFGMGDFKNFDSMMSFLDTLDKKLIACKGSEYLENFKAICKLGEEQKKQLERYFKK